MRDVLSQDYKKAITAAQRLLKVRIRSEAELKERLKRKGFDEDVIVRVVSYFKDIGIIDDRKFARLWIEWRLAKPFGRARIKRELQQKGIDEFIIEDELSAAMQGSYNENDVVARLVKKQINRYKRFPIEKIKQRLYGYLLRRGFGSCAIGKVLNKIDRLQEAD